MSASCPCLHAGRGEGVGPVDELAGTCVEDTFACVAVSYSSEGELPRGALMHLEHHHAVHSRVPRHLCASHPPLPCSTVGWWLSRRSTPWFLVGIQPPVRLRPSFVNQRRRLVRIVTCGLTDSETSVNENDDGDIPGEW
jgi:hypothetical protein